MSDGQIISGDLASGDGIWDPEELGLDKAQPKSSCAIYDHNNCNQSKHCPKADNIIGLARGYLF